MMRKYFAEFFGTFWLVFGGCGSAIFAAAYPEVGIGFAGVALAFGLTVLTMAYAVGHISGGHFNPAVTIGLLAGGRFDVKQVIPYVISQIIGGLVAAWVLYLIATGKVGFDVTAGFATNGFGEHSPGGYSFAAAAITEIVLTAFFVIIIHGATDKKAPTNMAPIAIGLALTLIHLISIPITNTSVNPARSIAVAFFEGGIAREQLWFFWIMPIIGGAIGGFIYRYLLSDDCSSCETDTTQTIIVENTRKHNQSDLTIIEGIGPKVSAILNTIGIHSWHDLASTDVNTIKTLLHAEGGIYVAMDPTTWPAQASLAVKGKFEELEKWQAELSAGRITK